MVGLVFSYVMPIAARAGLFGSALQRKTVQQDAINVPLLLAGRTEPPMTITAILERPLLGWGSAMNMTPDMYTHAEHLAIRMGFSPTFPFDLLAVAAHATTLRRTRSCLGSWAEGGVLAALLPASCWSPVSGSSGISAARTVGAARSDGGTPRDLGPDVRAVAVQHDSRLRLHRIVVLGHTFPGVAI